MAESYNSVQTTEDPAVVNEKISTLQFLKGAVLETKDEVLNT